MNNLSKFQRGSNQRRVERVSQATIEVPTSEVRSSFESIRGLLIDWLSRKAGGKLPESILRGDTGDFDTIGFQRVEAAALDDPLYWAARQDDQDRNFPRRSWITEAAIAPRENSVVIGYRLHCVTLGESAPFARSVPRFMREIARSTVTCLDGREIELKARRIDSDDDVEWLFSLLASKSRAHPVIGIAQSYRPADTQKDGYLIDADVVANALFGTAHVCQISRGASEELSKALGDLAVLNGGVRSWRYPFTLEDSRHGHPLATAKNLDTWAMGAGPAQFQIDLIDWALRHSAGRRDAEKALPPFALVRHLVAQRERQIAKDAGRSDEDLLALALADNDRLDREIDGMREEQAQLLELADQDVRRLQEERDDALTEQVRLHSRLQHLEIALRERREEAVQIPDDLSAIGDWCQENLDDRVVMLPRAINMARKSPFDDGPFVFQVLLAIRDYYVPMRRTGDAETKAAWDQKAQELGLILTPSFAGAGAGEFGDEYKVMWQGRNRELDMHFKGCSSRDARYGFRCYFFWDDDAQAVVVGAVPGHLTTRAT
jgi:hypothetical protein